MQCNLQKHHLLIICLFSNIIIFYNWEVIIDMKCCAITSLDICYFNLLSNLLLVAEFSCQSHITDLYIFASEVVAPLLMFQRKIIFILTFILLSTYKSVGFEKENSYSYYEHQLLINLYI